jgi:hypothetical protein
MFSLEIGSKFNPIVVLVIIVAAMFIAAAAIGSSWAVSL